MSGPRGTSRRNTCVGGLAGNGEFHSCAKSKGRPLKRANCEEHREGSESSTCLSSDG